MATPPGNSTPGASTRCTIRHLVDAVCKIRRQKQCATTARIHKAVRQQLQRNVEVEEVLEQLNAATSIGELWRVDNNGVTSYREPPKGTSKEHLKWAGEKHPTKWPTKDQSGGQFMMGHVKYPVNEHLTQPMGEHLTQRANEHVPWAMPDQLRCSTAEPLREHVMEPSRCAMNEAFMWPMAEPMRWPAMNDPMSWPAAEPLRQPTGELTQQRSAETPSWPMNEPFRRPMNESLAWSMNQSLRGPMAEPLAWHVTEPLRHPMADPLAWSVPEPLRRPMTEPLSWHGNDQLRRSMAEPLGWAVNNPEPFRRTAAEHFNWCAPDAVRQSAKEPYAKPVKDTSSTRNLNNISSSGWPLRETTQAAHTSAKALSRSVMNSQKDSFKETSASTFACPVSQTMGVGTVNTQNKTRSFSPATRHANSKFHSNPPQLPVSCKNVQNPCAELQRTCKELPGMREDLPRCDVQRLPEGSFLGVAQNPYLVSSQSMGEFAMMTNNQGFCAQPVGQYGCPNNRTASLVSNEPGSLGMNRAPLQHTSEIAPEIPAIVHISDACQKAGQQLESSCLRKCSGLPGKSNGSNDKTSSQSEKCLPSGTDTIRVNDSIPRQVPDEVLKVARSLLQEAEPDESLIAVESRTVRVESSNTFQDTQMTGTAGLSSSTPSVTENNNFSSLNVQNVLQPELPPVPCSLNITNEQEPLFNSCGDALDAEANMPSFGICLENCASGNSSAPSLEPPAEEKQHSASAQLATDLTGHLSDTNDTATDTAVPEPSVDQTSYSEDKAMEGEAAIANDHDVTLNFPFLLETQSPCKDQRLPQMPKCRRNLQNKKRSSKRKRFNFGSLTFLISVVIRSTRACNAGKDVATSRSIKNLILSKYDVASQDLPLLSGRIRLACKRAVQSGRLRRKGHVFTLASSKIGKLSLFIKDASRRINKLGAKEHGGSTAKQPICVESSNGSADGGDSSRTLASSHQCSLTDMHGLLESNTPEEESPLRPPSVDEMGTASDPVQPPEANSPTEDPVSATVSAQREPNEGQTKEDPERSRNTDENIQGDNTEQQYHGDMNPKGLIDGLTRFFTPSNKRNSRVSRNTLQRTLELKVKNGSSSPKSRMLTLVPRGQQQQPRQKSVKAASVHGQSSAFFRLDKNKDAQHRRTAAGRRREQLYDGLSHFFAVDGKRRSCTLGRCHGSDLSLENAPFYMRNSMLYLGKKWDMSEKGSELGSEGKLSRLAGRVIRSRTRSLSLSGLKEPKTSAQSKKQLSRLSPESKSLSHLNTCVPNALCADKRHSHTFTYSTRLSKQSTSDSSESLLCHDRSRSSGPSKTSAVSCTAGGRSTAAKGEPSLGDSVMRNENDVSTCDVTHFKSSNVPFDAKNTSTHPPTSRQLDVVEHCKLSATESHGTTVSSSSSLATFPTTGKSAMVKLTRLSSNDCSLFLSHGSSCQSEPPSVVETKSLQNLESSGVKIEACVDPVSPTKEDQPTEHPTVLDAADARRIVRPGMTPNDMILFRKAQKIAAERILVSTELNNLDPCQPTPPHIQFGPYELTTVHSSLYPPEFARLPKLFICEFCLKYLKNHCALELHMAKCRQRYPPGNELYRLDNLSVFEVDGSASPIYCQNLCLLARLFLSSKSPMQSNMSPFLFYIATLNDDTGSHLVGYFAKEKYGLNGSYSLVSLLVLPPYRRKGYGDFLIQLSYLICRLNKSHGSPLRPLSSVASSAFNANWSKTIMEFIKTYWTPEQALTIRDISVRTGIHPTDVTSVLSSLQLIDGTKQDIGTALSLDAEIVEKCVSQWVLPYVNKRLRIDLKLLQGTKSSLQHLLKTSIESEKLSHIVTRKSARKIQRKRTEDDFVSASGSECAESTKKMCERHVTGSHGMCSCCSDFETKSRAAKRKTLSSSPVSPSKSARLSSSDCAAWLSGKLSSSVEASETPGEKSESPSSATALASNAATISLSHPVTSDTSVNCHGAAVHVSTKSDAQEPDQKVTSASQLMASTTVTESAGRHGGLEATEITSKTEPAELKQVPEKKSTRTVAVQTDAYDSDLSDDDDDSSESSSGSSSCSSSSSSCCSSTSSEESEAEETPAEAQVQNTKSEAKTSADALDAVVPGSEELSENMLSMENETSPSSSSGSTSSSGDSSSAAGTIPESGPSSQPVTYCEVPYEEGEDSSQKLESACEVLNRTFVSNGEFATGRQNCRPQDPEGEDESSRQSLRDTDLILCNTKPASAADISHQLPEGANVQGDFAQTKVNTGTGNMQGQLACCVRKADVDPRDSYSGAAAVNDSFQFGSSLSSVVPNIGMESPMSVNSCSEMSGCNIERAPSQAYSDCAQVQNVYNMENMGASPACGYGVNQSMTQMTSPAGSSQITSPVSNQSFNIASCSPAAGNGSGYGSAVESAIGAQLPGAAANHMTGSGTTFKMPVEDTRYVAASSSYNVNGYGTAMASPASVGQCGYVGQYAEQSPGGQCGVINQNSPNGLGYTMPTPSPTNSSSRSFNMASPNTNAYHGQPSVPQAYDRSCPSAPVLSYARVLQQQLPGAADAVPWTHFYPPQPTGYSLIKFPEQELVPQHAVALPRNLIPAAQPTVAVQQHLTQVNLVPLATKPTKCPGPTTSTQSKQHRRCGKSCKSNACNSSSLSTVRSQTVAPNVTIQPGTNMITSYNVINMNVDYRAQQAPPIAAYPSGPYISNAALINDAQQMQSLNIYQHRAIDFPRQPRPHNNVYTATYGYINGAIAQQSFNIMRQQ